MARSSGNWTMYLAGLHGQGTSSSPGCSGAPSEWTHSTNGALSWDIFSSTGVPMVAMMRMEHTTYGESVISTPYCGLAASREPITNGITYMVRPCMAPEKRFSSVSFMTRGSSQLLVGPAPFSVLVQMKVRSSTRATSSGSENAAKELGNFSWDSRTRVPASTIWSVSCVHSASDPSAQWMRSGCASSAISRTQSVRAR